MDGGDRKAGWYVPGMRHNGWCVGMVFSRNEQFDGGDKKSGMCERMVSSRNEPLGWGSGR